MTNIGLHEVSSNQPDQRYMLGEVTNWRQADIEDYAIPLELAPAGIFEVTVSDPYLASMNIDRINDVQSRESLANLAAETRRKAGMWERKPGTAYTNSEGNEQRKGRWGDPVTSSEFFEDLGSAAMNLWRRNVIPNAEALKYLSDPVNVSEVVTPSGLRSEIIDDAAREWWTATSDAIGIRSRGAIMARLLADYADHLTVEEKTNLHWMSVACGTALPTMQAAMLAGIEPHLTLVDMNKNALRNTQFVGEEIGFKGNLTSLESNIFDFENMAQVLNDIIAQNKRPKVVDAMGIFEYTGESVGVDSAEFLKSIYSLPEPGGRLIFGQMRSDRPNADFTMGVVGWPYVEMRSPSEFMQVVVDAGIDPKEVSLYMPDDGVYMVGIINKATDSQSNILAA